jgi:membrane protein implicated in regulation of membrane protease activity
MGLSPRLLAIAGVVVALVTAGVVVLEHEAFWAGIVTGLLGTFALVLLVAAVVRRKLEDQLTSRMEEVSEAMGVDVMGLLSSMGQREVTKPESS